MIVKLYTRDGGFVTEAEIPPFNEAPRVILWGLRVFVVNSDVYGQAIVHHEPVNYTEAFAYAIPVYSS